MEPTNHPIGKENDLPNLHDYVPCESTGVYVFHKRFKRYKALKHELTGPRDSIDFDLSCELIGNVLVCT